MISLATFKNRFNTSVLGFSLFVGVMANAQEIPKAHASPGAVARESFNAMKRNDIPGYASLLHPAEAKRFKTFALNVFEYDEPAKGIHQMRKLFAPYDSLKTVSSASGSELLIAWLTNTFAAIPGFLEIIADAELQILGEIDETAEDEKAGKVHVITRTVLPRPSPVSCQQLDGRWYQLLNDETLRMVSAFQRINHFKKKDTSSRELIQKQKLDQIEVLGYVNDGKDLAHVLCRVTMKIDDFSYKVFGCYPVRNGEPAWELLNNKDKSKLIAALRGKWVR